MFSARLVLAEKQLNIKSFFMSRSLGKTYFIERLSGNSNAYKYESVSIPDTQSGRIEQKYARIWM